MGTGASVPPVPVVDDDAPSAEARALLTAQTTALAGLVGARVRARRIEQGRSQEDVAHSTLIARNSLQTIERGEKANPRLSTLVGLAETLGVTVAYLVSEDDGVA